MASPILNTPSALEAQGPLPDFFDAPRFPSNAGKNANFADLDLYASAISCSVGSFIGERNGVLTGKPATTYFPSTENARSTFPGMPPHWP